jgi:hypothetical protein
MIKHIRPKHNNVYNEDLKSREFVLVAQDTQQTVLDHKVCRCPPAIELYYTNYCCADILSDLQV